MMRSLKGFTEQKSLYRKVIKWSYVTKFALTYIHTY